MIQKRPCRSHSQDPSRAVGTDGHHSEDDQVFSGTTELLSLLNSYVRALDEIDSKRRITWWKPCERMPWLGLPAVRWFIKMFFVSRVHRCVSALQAGVVRHGGVGFELASKKQDIDVLNQFDQTVPKSVRIHIIWPVALLAALVVANMMAIANGDLYSRLLGELAKASVNLDRTAMIAAFSHSERFAEMNQLGGPTKWMLLVGAAVTVSTAAGILVLPLLPAFGVYRQLRAPLATVEDRAFTAVDAGEVKDIELDLVTGALLIPLTAWPTMLFMWALYSYVRDGRARDGGKFALEMAGIVLTLVLVTVLAAAELWIRYRERRSPIQLRSNKVRRILRVFPKTALLLVVANALTLGRGPDLQYEQSDDSELEVASDPAQLHSRGHDEIGTIDDISFMVTAIEQNAQCHDPHSGLFEDPQYLRFTLETWSTRNEFADPAEARYLSLNHWSILNSRGDTSYDPSYSLYMHASCGRGTEAIAKPLVPGTHTVTDVVVTAPRDAAILQLAAPAGHQPFHWHIPPINR